MRWQLSPAKRSLAERAGSWDASNRLCFGGHPLLDTRFLLPLVSVFGTAETTLAVLDPVGHEAGGALLLRPRASGVWSTFLPSQAQIAPVVLPPSRVDALNDLMRRTPSRCWLLEMMNQDPAYFCFSGGIPAHADEIFHAETLRVELSGDFPSYWKARPKGLRKHLRRYLNAVKEHDPPVSLRVVQDPAEVVAGLRRYGELEVRGWKGASGSAVHADNEQGRFYRAVLESFAANGNAYVYELYFGDRLAASRLCIASEDIFVVLKTTYDEDLSRYAPGRLLLYQLLESQFRLGRYRVVEFYTHASKEMLAWGSESRSIFHVDLFRNDFARRGLVVLRRLKRTFAGTSGNASRTRPERIRLERGQENQAASHRIQLITTRSELEGLREEWTRTCDLDGYRSIFLSHEWFESIMREFPADREIAIYLVRSKKDGSLRAIFPMMASHCATSWLRAPILKFLTNAYSPIAKPIYATRKQPQRLRAARAFVRHLRERTARWAHVDFNLLPGATRDFEVLQEALAAEGLPYRTYFGGAHWIVPTRGMTSSRGGPRIRSRLQSIPHQQLDRARRVGEVRFAVLTKPDVVPHMEVYEEVRAEDASHPEPDVRFHRRLVERLVPHDKVALGLLYLAGVPAAAQIWLFHEGVASVMERCQDRRYEDFSPGMILTDRLMTFAIDERRVARIDFPHEEEPFTADAVSVRQDRRGIIAFNDRTFRGRIAAIAEAVSKGGVGSTTRVAS